MKLRSMTSPRQTTIELFRQALSQADAFLVGAAVGAGITAKAAERGGADFLLALNAGRFRMMGASSIAAMLPLRDSNQFVSDFALSEILNITRLPVFFGASHYRPAMQAGGVAAEVCRQGFSGITNFPTCVHYSDEFQQLLERRGLGFDRELELVKAGQDAGLCGIAYVGSVRQARLAAQAGCDLVCMNFGWNTGAATGVLTAMSLSDVAARSHEFVKTVRSWSPASICVLEGGPIEKAEDLFEICRDAKVDGYIGGSTIELMPMDDSVAETTTEFKMTRMLRGRIDTLEKRLSAYQLQHDLIGNSDQMSRIIEQMSDMSSDQAAIIISGETGSGKTAIAKALAQQYTKSDEASWYSFDKSTMEQRAMSDLFGVASNRQNRRKSKLGIFDRQNQGTIVIENIELAPKSIQSRIVQFLECGAFKRVYGRKLRQSHAKLILTSNQKLNQAKGRGRIPEEMASSLRGREINLPPLRERIGDIPALVNRFSELNANTIGLAHLELAPSAIRELMSYDWPENISELARVIKSLQSAHVFGKTGAEAVNRVLDQSQMDGSMGAPENGERIWILQALRRNGFRRIKAAKELGMSRKTLYNKIKLYNIMG